MGGELGIGITLWRHRQEQGLSCIADPDRGVLREGIGYRPRYRQMSR